MHLIPVIAWGFCLYCALLAVAFLVTYQTPARQRARRMKKCATRTGKRIEGPSIQSVKPLRGQSLLIKSRL